MTAPIEKDYRVLTKPQVRKYAGDIARELCDNNEDFRIFDDVEFLIDLIWLKAFNTKKYRDILKNGRDTIKQVKGEVA